MSPQPVAKGKAGFGKPGDRVPTKSPPSTQTGVGGIAREAILEAKRAALLQSSCNPTSVILDDDSDKEDGKGDTIGDEADLLGTLS